MQRDCCLYRIHSLGENVLIETICAFEVVEQVHTAFVSHIFRVNRRSIPLVLVLAFLSGTFLSGTFVSGKFLFGTFLYVTFLSGICVSGMRVSGMLLETTSSWLELSFS